MTTDTVKVDRDYVKEIQTLHGPKGSTEAIARVEFMSAAQTLAGLLATAAAKGWDLEETGPLYAIRQCEAHYKGNAATARRLKAAEADEEIPPLPLDAATERAVFPSEATMSAAA